MIKYNIIQNYSEVLFRCAVSSKKEITVLKEIIDFNKMLQDVNKLSLLFYSPIIQNYFKLKLVDFISKKCKFEQITGNFLSLLVKHNKISALSEIIDLYDILILRHKNIKSVEVLSASELHIKGKKYINDIMMSELNSEIKMTCNIDASLIGGVIITYDTYLIDGSIKGALNKIKSVVSLS